MAAYDSATVAAAVRTALKNKHADKTLQPNLTDWIEAVTAIGDEVDVVVAAEIAAAIAAQAALDVQLADVLRGTVALGAENANVIAATVTIKDGSNATVAAAQQFLVRMYEATMIPAEATAVTLADGGAGTMDSTTAQAAGVFTTHTDGTCVINITDAAGASSKTFRMEVVILPAVGKVGCTTLTSVVFDGA